MVAAMVDNLNWDNNEIININDLKDKPLIIYRRFEKLILEECHKLGFEPKVFCKMMMQGLLCYGQMLVLV